MNNLSIIGLTLLLSSSLFAELPSANKARTITEKATKVAYKNLLSSKKGKKAYNKLMKIFEKNIIEIANEGFYDTFSITMYNSEKLGIQSAMKDLSKKDQDIMRQKIIKDLKKKGYKIAYNKYWDSINDFNIRVTW